MNEQADNRFTITKYNLPNSKNSSGTTSLIRNKLKFDDGIKWKYFCKIRNDLIKSYFRSVDMVHINLTIPENKTKVKQIADCLRIEFRYPVDTNHYFEKLVILAIQSIRRNLTRSQNNKLIKSKDLSSIVKDNIPSDTNLLSLVIKDIIDNVIPLKNQMSSYSHSNMSNSGLPDLSIFISKDPLLFPQANNNNRQDYSINKNFGDCPSIPFFLKEKIIHNIQKSRSCYQLSKINDTINVIEQYQNLLKLGHNALILSSRYVFERFYSNSSLHLMDFVLEQINKPKFLSQLSIQLFQSSTTMELSLNDHETLVPLLNITLGSLIKDFGFDPILYDISEIMYHFVSIKYPSLSKHGSINTNNNDNNNNNKNNNTFSGKHSTMDSSVVDSELESHLAKNKDIIVSSLSINPQIANKEVYKKVQIKYQTKVQDFNFPLLSNATPTIGEIITNCKQLFQIKKDLNLDIYYNDQIVRNDIKLANLFNDLNITMLCLELK